MSNREVMQQALEALENHEGNYKLGKAGCDRQEAAITAIKKALAQPVQPEQRKPLTDEQARVALGLAYLPGAAVMRDLRNIEAAHNIKEQP